MRRELEVLGDSSDALVPSPLELLRIHAERSPGALAAVDTAGGGPRSVTWAELSNEVETAGCALTAVCAPGERVAVMSECRTEALVAVLAAQSLGFLTVGIDPKSPASHRRRVIEDSGATVIFAGSEPLLSETLGLLAGGGSARARRGYYFDGSPARAGGGDSWESFMSVGAMRQQTAATEWRRMASGVGSGQPTWLFYTSGTTGAPKGALLTWEGIVRAYCEIFAFDHLGGNVPRQSDLSLHEVAWTSCAAPWLGLVYPLVYGCAVMMSRSAAQVAGRSLVPTIRYARPGAWEEMRQEVLSAVRERGLLGRLGFKAALWAATSHRGRALAPWLADLLSRLFVRPVLASSGLDAIRLAFTAGAPVNEAVLAFYQSLGIRVIEYYGMTECSGLAALATARSPVDGTPVYTPLPSLEIRLSGDGELLLRGPTVFRGYLNRPDPGSDATDDEGWYHTGDIAALVAERQFQIFGRLGDVVVLSTGERVPAAPIQTALAESPLIKAVVCAGDGRADIRVLVELDPEPVRLAVGEPGATYSDLAADPRVASILRDDIEEHAKRPAVRRHARVAGFEILRQPLDLSDEAIATTVTKKLKRRGILAANAELVERLYEDRGNPASPAGGREWGQQQP